ncbi:MAG: deoxyribonuclease V [Thermodesulfobacteriota bacterium]
MNNSLQKKFTKLYSETPFSVQEAFKFQTELSKKVVKKNSFNKINRVAGADLAIFTKQKKLLCGIIIFSYPDLEIIEKVYHIADEMFPYIPGLLAFREGPAIIETFKKIKIKPDLIMVDGQGIAHPRFFGIACHVGVLLDIPTVGVAKKRLFGEHTEPGSQRGSWNKLKNKGGRETIGAVLRTKDNVKPVFVSIGNKIDLVTSVKIAIKCSRGYRIPEPTRQADKFVAQLKQEINL